MGIKISDMTATGSAPTASYLPLVFGGGNYKVSAGDLGVGAAGQKLGVYTEATQSVAGNSAQTDIVVGGLAPPTWQEFLWRLACSETSARRLITDHLKERFSGAIIKLITLLCSRGITGLSKQAPLPTTKMAPYILGALAPVVQRLIIRFRT